MIRDHLLNADKLGFSPPYILFEVSIDNHRLLGRFTTTYLSINNPFGAAKSYKFESFNTTGKYQSGAEPDILDRVEPQQITVFDIMDASNDENQNTLNQIIEISESISEVDTSFNRSDIKEKIQHLFEVLHSLVASYGNSHPKSNYRSLLKFIELEQSTISKLSDPYTSDEVINRKIMRENVDDIKKGLLNRISFLVLNGELES